MTAVSAETLSLSTGDTFTVGEEDYLAIEWTTSHPLIVGDIITITLPTNYMEFVETNSVVIFFDTTVASITVSSGATIYEKQFTISSLQSGT